MRLKILTDREAILRPIAGGVCPVGGPVGGPVAPPPPPGEPHLVGANAGTAATMWVTGALLRFRSGDGNEYGETGAAQPTPPVPAALLRTGFVTGEDLAYFDDSGIYRKVSKASLGAKPVGTLTLSPRYDVSQSMNRRITFAGATNHYAWSNGF